MTEKKKSDDDRKIDNKSLNLASGAPGGVTPETTSDGTYNIEADSLRTEEPVPVKPNGGGAPEGPARPLNYYDPDVRTFTGSSMQDRARAPAEEKHAEGAPEQGDTITGSDGRPATPKST